jgi:Zn finger protein HypA/HybF involved in hydrogenase expression
MKNLTYRISIPTDNGFLGRQCKKCDKYFKIDADQIKDNMYCPYCGELQESDDMLTKEQVSEIDSIAQQLGKRYFEDALDKVFGKMARGNKFISYKPGKKTQIKEIRNHLEKEVDSQIECPSCNTKFQVYGIFGYCPGCSEDNILIYEANLQIIINEVENSTNPQRALRHAYGDLVTTFELYCKKVSKNHDLGGANFQNLKNTKDFFKKFDVDIYEGIEYSEKVAIKRIFEKRHAYGHGPGEITDSYIKNVPEDSKLIGQIAELSKAEFLTGVSIIKKIIKNIRDELSS